MDLDRPAYKWWIALSVVPAGLVHAVDATSVGIAISNMITNLQFFLRQFAQRALAHLHKMMLEEAIITAYRDFFLVSAGISLFIILPALLRTRTLLSSSGAKEAPVTVEERTSRA